MNLLIMKLPKQPPKFLKKILKYLEKVMNENYLKPIHVAECILKKSSEISFSS